MSTTPRFFSGITIEDILSISSIETVGPLAWQKIYRSYNSLKSALSENGKSVLTDAQSSALRNRKSNQQAEKNELSRHNIKIILIGQKEYPKLLSEIPDPPLWLFYRGNISTLKTNTISVVGSRKASNYGSSVIETLLPPALLEKLATVSGLAYGIDKKIHDLSLKVGGRTVAVLAGGLDVIYPLDHTHLANKIVEAGGLLLSEYPPLSRPKGYRFPIRNRIIAGLSTATVVVEAAIKSGSLTTAKSAVDYNRDVFAVPGDITRLSSTGTNYLLQTGATPLTNPTQLFDYFGIDSKSVLDQSVDSELREVLDLLIQDPKTIEQIAVVVDKPIEVVLGLVAQLELLNLINQPKPGYYICK